MGGYIYQHFEGVPDNVEKEYNRLGRREYYLEERDKDNGLLSYSYGNLPEIVDPTTTEEYKLELEIEMEWERRRELLPSALEWLKTHYSYEYEMIRAYYFGRNNEKMTLMQLAGEYGVSAMSITRTLRRGSRYLRNYIIRHEKTG